MCPDTAHIGSPTRQTSMSRQESLRKVTVGIWTRVIITCHSSSSHHRPLKVSPAERASKRANISAPTAPPPDIVILILQGYFPPPKPNSPMTVGIQSRYHTPRDPKSCWAILILLAPMLAFGAFHPWWLRPSPVFLRPKDQEHPSKTKKEREKSQTIYKYTQEKQSHTNRTECKKTVNTPSNAVIPAHFVPQESCLTGIQREPPQWLPMLAQREKL